MLPNLLVRQHNRLHSYFRIAGMKTVHGRNHAEALQIGHNNYPGVEKRHFFQNIAPVCLLDSR